MIKPDSTLAYSKRETKVLMCKRKSSVGLATLKNVNEYDTFSRAAHFIRKSVFNCRLIES